MITNDIADIRSVYSDLCSDMCIVFPQDTFLGLIRLNLLYSIIIKTIKSEEKYCFNIRQNILPYVTIHLLY